MRPGSIVRGVLLTTVVGILSSTPMSAQVAIPDGYEVGTHIVRAGDTLRALTTAYLGSEELWQQNWKLNPQVKDPDLLIPLQRLKIIVAPRVARPTARLTTISGNVDGKPAPSDWYPSEEDDLMIERDGVRAGKDSSTVMEFLDGTQLKVKDDSTVFLRVAGRSLRGFEQRSVEVVRGEADLAAARLPVETEIEVVIGSTVAMPKTAEDGSLETRARRAETGGAQVMVFEGVGEVVAAGQSVKLEEGTGTAVPETGPPAPPEKLLPAVVGLAPEPGGEVEAGRAFLSWTPLEGAASYTVELCRDRGCDNLVTRRTGLGESRWETGDLPLGEFVWRVMAVSDSGLDGYASESQAVTLVPFRNDSAAPTGEFVVTGRSGEADGVVYHGPDLRIRLEIEDDVTGVETVTYTINGGEVSADALLGPWSTGDYQVAATAVDLAGNSASFGPLEFHIDADPPVIENSVAGSELAAESVTKRWKRRARRWSRRELRGVRRLGWAPRCQVLDLGTGVWNPPAGFLPNLDPDSPPVSKFSIERSQSGLLVFAPALSVDSGVPLGDRVLLLGMEDRLSGMVEVEVGRRSGPDGWNWLEITATDLVGNEEVRRWPFMAWLTFAGAARFKQSE